MELGVRYFFVVDLHAVGDSYMTVFIALSVCPFAIIVQSIRIYVYVSR